MLIELQVITFAYLGLIHKHAALFITFQLIILLWCNMIAIVFVVKWLLWTRLLHLEARLLLHHFASMENGNSCTRIGSYRSLFDLGARLRLLIQLQIFIVDALTPQEWLLFIMIWLQIIIDMGAIGGLSSTWLLCILSQLWPADLDISTLIIDSDFRPGLILTQVRSIFLV